jgi:hypothetical protein
LVSVVEGGTEAKGVWKQAVSGLGWVGTGEWRSCVLRSSVICTLLQILFIKSTRMRWAGNVARIWGRGDRHTYRVLVVKPEGERPHGRLRRRWEDNIKMDLQELE